MPAERLWEEKRMLVREGSKTGRTPESLSRLLGVCPLTVLWQRVKRGVAPKPPLWFTPRTTLTAASRATGLFLLTDRRHMGTPFRRWLRRLREALSRRFGLSRRGGFDFDLSLPDWQGERLKSRP